MSYLSLIKRIRRRPHSLGIGTAADYLRELEICLGGRCPSGLLAGVSRRQWRAWIKAARRKLVYHHAEMLVEGAGGLGLETTGIEPANSQAPSPQSLVPSLSSPQPLAPVPPHTIATFPAVITTTRQDLDGDVLETAGAELDPRAPLLWQHLPDLPIGRLLDVGEHTERRLTGRFAIANTALGQDAALLAEHGALRISHGFLPSKWEPLESDDAFAGYHILQFKILEVSLVSVPSNPDAVIEAFSREKLAHPLVKAWAGSRFEDRPVIVPVLKAEGKRQKAEAESPPIPSALCPLPFAFCLLRFFTSGAQKHDSIDNSKSGSRVECGQRATRPRGPLPLQSHRTSRRQRRGSG